jgi:hypothetical protein
MKKPLGQEADAIKRQRTARQHELLRVNSVTFVAPSRAEFRTSFFRLFDALELGDDLRPTLKKVPPGVK